MCIDCIMSDMKRKQVLSQLERKEERGINVMYLGDSENDNPAFRKSDISIGIRSDPRLNPMLNCKYMLDF